MVTRSDHGNPQWPWQPTATMVTHSDNGNPHSMHWHRVCKAGSTVLQGGEWVLTGVTLHYYRVSWYHCIVSESVCRCNWSFKLRQKVMIFCRKRTVANFSKRSWFCYSSVSDKHLCQWIDLKQILIYLKAYSITTDCRIDASTSWAFISCTQTVFEYCTRPCNQLWLILLRIRSTSIRFCWTTYVAMHFYDINSRSTTINNTCCNVTKS